ncbi:MAG TPA: hypothetical protein VGJ06_06395 [Candidatus Acidoferrum sp.]|jgi:hypothetical protein
MPHKTHSYVAYALAGACAALLFFSMPVRGQDSQSQNTQSVADAARAARAAKKAKTAKVISDEDIDKSSYKPGDQGLNVGSAPTSDAQAPNSAEVKTDLKADNAQVAAETTAVVKQGEDPEIARAREALAAASEKLDLLKRANALDQDTYLSKPNYTTDHAGKSKLDAEQAEITDQQSVVDDLKAKLEQLKAEHGITDPDPGQKKKSTKPQNAGFTMPDKTSRDQPASDQQPAPQQ